MNFFSAMDISASALSAQRVRMNVISTNLANAHTTRTPEGGPFRRKEVVFSAQQLNEGFESALTSIYDQHLMKVEVFDIINDPRPPRLVYDPSHPDANEQGYVLLPNVNTVEEMVNMISATRSYEANVSALNTLKSMMQRALQIGQ